MIFKVPTIELKKITKFLKYFDSSKMLMIFKDKKWTVVLSEGTNYLKFDILGKDEGIEEVAFKLKSVSFISDVIKDLTRKKGVIIAKINSESHQLTLCKDNDTVNVDVEFMDMNRFSMFFDSSKPKTECDTELLSNWITLVSKKTSTTLVSGGQKKKTTLNMFEKSFIKVSSDSYHYLSLTPMAIYELKHINKDQYNEGETRCLAVRDSSFSVFKKVIAAEMKSTLNISLLKRYINLKLEGCELYIHAETMSDIPFPDEINEHPAIISILIHSSNESTQFAIEGKNVVESPELNSKLIFPEKTIGKIDDCAIIFCLPNNQIKYCNVREIKDLCENSIAFSYTTLSKVCYLLNTCYNIEVYPRKITLKKDKDESLLKITLISLSL